MSCTKSAAIRSKYPREEGIMSNVVVLPTQQEYLKAILIAALALSPDHSEMWWREEDGSDDDIVHADIGLATELLSQSGLDRSQARKLAHTLRYLDVGAGTNCSAYDFAQDLLTTHTAIRRRIDMLENTHKTPGPFEIVAYLIDPLVRQGIPELAHAALYAAVRWLDDWGYSSDVRVIVLALVGFDPQASLGERANAFRRLFSPASSEASRLANPAINSREAITAPIGEDTVFIKRAMDALDRSTDEQSTPKTSGQGLTV
jgi:hypothetical protein